jgi:hypothetical protein
MPAERPFQAASPVAYAILDSDLMQGHSRGGAFGTPIVEAAKGTKAAKGMGRDRWYPWAMFAPETRQ